MDVKLPDGTVVKNVPEGTTKAELMAKLPPERFREIKAQGNVVKPPPMFTPSGEKHIPKITDPEMIAANPVVRASINAAEPILGAMQMVEQAATGGKGGLFNDHMNDLNKIRQRGQSFVAEHDPTGDITGKVMGAAGVVGSPVFMGAAGSMPATTSAGGRIAQGGKMGLLAGATEPIYDTNTFWGDKAQRTALSGLAGMAIPASWEVAKGGGRFVRDVADTFTERGAGNILSRYQNKIIGDTGRAELIAALRNAGEPLPGYKPTAAEAVATLPQGSPLLAHQKITAGTPGGPSAAFGQRVLDQKAALAEALRARNESTAPLREAALESANMGGVRADAIVDAIDKTLNEPGPRASDVVSKTLNAVKEKIAALTGETGVIDANDLYTIRKEIGNTVKTFAKDTSNWDKKLTSGIERNIQKSIDDAIESAGGTGWGKYLEDFSSQSAKIDAVKNAVKSTAKPPQRTNLGGGMNVAEESRLHLPNVLSRPMMVTNAILKRVSEGIEPKLDREATRRYLNPAALADALEKAPLAKRQALVDALMRYQAPAGVAAVNEGVE